MGYGNIKSGTTVRTAEVNMKLKGYQANHNMWIIPDQLQNHIDWFSCMMKIDGLHKPSKNIPKDASVTNTI